jgi:hypothetical protein
MGISVQLHVLVTLSKGKQPQLLTEKGMGWGSVAGLDNLEQRKTLGPVLN